MLSQEQIDQFHRDGFLVIRNMFAADELKLLRQAADRVQAEGIAGTGEHHLYQNVEGQGKTYFRSERMWDRDPIFQAVTVKPDLLTCIGQCVGEAFLPMNDSFVCKLPGGNVPVHWHQDPPYGDPKRVDTFAVPNFDTDIYLDDSTVENGCVWGIPGHHLVGHVDLAAHSEEELFNDFGAVPIEMAAGDVLFHCLSAPHGSVGNQTDSIRRIFYVHYMAEAVLDNCYGQWKNQKRGFSDEGKAFVQEMMSTRKAMGYDVIADDPNHPLRWTDEGFQFAGSPNTPLAHWGTLIDGMPEAEKNAKRNLQSHTVAA